MDPGREIHLMKKPGSFAAIDAEVGVVECVQLVAVVAVSQPKISFGECSCNQSID